MAKRNNSYILNILSMIIVAAMAFVFTETNTRAQEYPSGMISYWKFDENTGVMASDSVGTNHGTIYEAACTTGVVGNALSFDGVDDCVEVPDSDSLSFGDGSTDSPFSIEAWVKWIMLKVLL